MATVTDENEIVEWLSPWPRLLEHFNALVVSLKRRHLSGSYDASKKTTELLRVILGTVRWSHAAQLMTRIKTLGRVLTRALPHELAIGNVIRRVLYIIREEYMSAIRSLSAEEMANSNGAMMQPSLGTILTPDTVTDFTMPVKELKQSIMEGVAELMDEIDNLHLNIAEQAMEYIHANEVILTYGLSTSVEEFLKAAAKKRQFKVIVVESSPLLNGQTMAHRLAQAGIDTTVITDSAVFAMMARVNKVVIPAIAVVANGGLIAQSGIQNIALAAKRACVPVVCVAGLFKLCPLYPHDLDVLNELVSPAQIFNYDDTCENMYVLNPANDYVPPEFVAIFITNTGAYQPSYIYRLLAEYYSPQDYQWS